MGLLDSLFGAPGSDQSQALGLLGVALMGGQGPQGFQAALAHMAGAKDRQLRQDLLGLQMENMRSEIDDRKMSRAQKADLMKQAQGLLGASPSYSPGQLGSGSLGAVDTLPGQTAFPAPKAGGLGNVPMERVLALSAAGGPNLFEPWKYAREGAEEKPNTFRVMPDGTRRYVADIKDGIDYQDGRKVAIPGHMEFLTQQTLATEAPKAALTAAGTLNMRKNADGTETPVSALTENPVLQDMLARYFNGGGMGGGPRPSAAPPVAQPAMPPANRPVVAPDQQRARDAEAMNVLREELKNPNLPPDARAGIERELSRFTTAQSMPGFPTPTAVTPAARAPAYGKTTAQQTAEDATKVYKEGVAKDMVEMRKAIQTSGFAAPKAIAKYQQLGALLEGVDGGVLTPTGTNLASMANSLGFKIDKNLQNKEAAAALANEMALELRSPANGAGMPGAMSDKDREFLVSMIPHAGQSAKGRRMVIEANIAIARRNEQVAEFARKYEAKYGQLDNGFLQQLQAWSNANSLFPGGK